MPAIGATTGISIFIDSRMTSSSPTSTFWPTSTRTFHTFAVISARTSATSGTLQVVSVPAEREGTTWSSHGRRVVITGASRGIGEGLARRFAAAGANVALVARSADAIQKLAADLGGSAHPADLGDPEQVATLINQIEDEAGPIDVLVNNAGIDIEAAFWDHPARDVARDRADQPRSRRWSCAVR